MSGNLPDESYAAHLANLGALARKLHDSVHVVRVEMQTIDENLANLNRVGSGDDADFPFDDCRDVYAALADARRRIREVERIVKAYRRDLADVESEAPGQVEPAPAAPVRLTELAEKVAAGDVVLVSYPDWNDGEPVQLHLLSVYGDDVPEGCVGVRYSFVSGGGNDWYETDVVSAAALVTPCGGAE
ncbi:hypothetical protein ACFQVD_26835 [Streptosporangium amethystogenes subsp. fukuiense]|uniref:Uncharacterized protein n=1 Tax=Streptosporangium amethystogenes subsp. fukuiense TaxID=698418 RepID=A0ABW2T4Y4_9ACTN